jgi:Ca-activated chloride channel homolog
MNNKRSLLRSLGCAVVILVICAIDYFPSLRSLAQSGVLIPSTLKNEPDPSILSLQVMKVEIKIDNQHAWVKVLQIFDNRTNQVLEGKFLFALPVQASIADFAVWDGDLRLPGVILEKRRANQLYTQIKEEPVDPGLLQQDDEHGSASAFSAKVFPIPAYGTKRVELEYTEMLQVDNLTSRFSFPLKPSFGSPQRVGELQLHVKVLSDSPLSPLSFRSPTYQLRALKTGTNEQEYSFQARNIELKEDLDFDYTIDMPKSALSWSAHRAPERISAYDLRDPAFAAGNPDGYFEARAIFNEQPARKDKTQRSVLLLLDTSLSMNGEKLLRAVEAVDFFLHSLDGRDQFNLALFNSGFSAFSPTPLPVTPDNVERALGFVKSSMLSGGTDLNQALLNAVELIDKFPAGERSVFLISDANPTLRMIDLKRIVRSFDAANDSDKTPKARLFAMAIGSDANRTLLEELTRKCRGYFLQVRETQDISTHLKIVFARTVLGSIDGLQLISSDPKNFYHIYPAQMLHSFDQSSFAFVGRYKKPTREVEIKVQGRSGAELVTLSRRVLLPERETAHEHLPRLWARARVDALLYEINLNGERDDYIAEIIRLSQKYKFVTPYTAFLAAPRSLLRPRVIQPGDPVIRVKTDPSINSVFAVLPFGETVPLKFITAEGVWEARFLAPAWVQDGTYRCRLLMTDEKGNGYQEEKSFVIDSHPPRLSAILSNQTTIRAGEELIVKVSADRDTMRLIAKFYGAQPAQLAWSDREKMNIGRLRIPAGLASGQYRLTVSAEDFAHNQSSIEVPVTVIGR